jgi:cellobiose-specific phosphotransferase system component IIA
MRTARTVVCTLRLMSAAASVAAPLSVLLGVGAMLVACDDDNDPKTWVKKLDDPATRANAIKRLTQFYEDGMTKASNDAGAPEIKALLDTIVEPMAKTYTAGGLDEKTRVDLMKFLAETHDPRTQPAIAKALKDFEMGKTDDETRVACDSINFMAKAGTKLDQTVIDELWNVFARFQISKAKSERLYHAVQDAVLQVKDPSYADKAIDKLKATVPPNPSVDIQQDQLMWWQLTSVRILSELRYTKAVKPLIVALLTPTKTSTLGATIQFALLKMAKVAEPELIKCLNGGGGDADYTNDIKLWADDKSWIGVTAEVLAVIGRAPGRDAILAALPTADNDTARTELAQALTQMPSDPRCEPAFLDAYKKLTWDSSDTLLGSLKPRIALAQQSAKFYDPKLVTWLLKEMKGAPDYSAKIIQVEAESKLMTVDLQDDVAAALANLKKETPADGFAKVQQMFDATSAPLLKCKADVGCYLAVLDEPIPSVPPTSYYRQVKATWMTVIYGSGNANGTRAELLKRVDKVQNTGARIALCEAIDELAPQGDVAAADALDKIVANDVKSGDKTLVGADNTVAQVAWRLRVRGQ